MRLSQDSIAKRRSHVVLNGKEAMTTRQNGKTVREWCRTTAVSSRTMLPVLLGAAVIAILGAIYLGSLLPVTAPVPAPRNPIQSK